MTTKEEDHVKHSGAGLPFVTVKLAQSLDGRIATASGDSQWISSPLSLKLAHKLRSNHDAIMVGIGTALADDPRLTVRLVKGRDPLRIIVDSRLRLPADARMLTEGGGQHTLLATTEMADRKRASELERLGAEIFFAPTAANKSQVDLRALLQEVGRRGIKSVLVEGGSGIVTSLFAARLIDRLVVIIAPKIIGKGTEAIADLSIVRLRDAITFSEFKTRRLGPDIVFDGSINWNDER
ncbi:MAG TPA: RibD family protein [Blastocatellia bacterium]|nr:RibD family protein [Blastocatellia bacterium]